MRRGDIWLVDLDPAIGSEASKVRPVVVVSNDGANAVSARTLRGTVTVVPLTSNVATIRPFQVLLSGKETGLRVDSKAQCEQVRAVSPLRMKGRIGSVPLSSLRALDDALRLHLGL